MKYTALPNDQTIPALGLGTWKSRKNEVYGAVIDALVLGYRHIDCAPAYENEHEVGEALLSSIQRDVTSRDELWITSKLWNNAHAPEDVEQALKKSLTDLHLDYLDLYLIHWPVVIRSDVFFPGKGSDYLPLREIPTHETWQAMEECIDKGLVKNIGVCNFSIKKLAELTNKATTKPVMNQIELHPYLQQEKMLDFCTSNQIALTAYSPLGSADRPRGMKKDDEPTLLANPQIISIAKKHSLTPGQLLLLWALQRETVVIPKSVTPAHLKENFMAASLNITLDKEDMIAIAALDLGHRYVDGRFWTGNGSPYTYEELWDE